MDELVKEWSAYFSRLKDWQSLIAGVTPKDTDCGPVYELDNPIYRPGESFAIADMRELSITGAHYHTGGEAEVYFVLQGTGMTVVGGKEVPLELGTVVVTPPETAHFTIPGHKLVLGVVDTPPFKAENVVSLEISDASVGFDREQYDSLSAIAHGR